MKTFHRDLLSHTAWVMTINKFITSTITMCFWYYEYNVLIQIADTNNKHYQMNFNQCFCTKVA